MTLFRQTSISRQNLGLALGIAGMVTFAATLPARRLGVTALDPLFLSAASATLAGCTAFVTLALAAPVNGERIDLETILFAAAVVTTVVIGQRMRVTRG